MISFFVLLKALSHSTDITDIKRVLKVFIDKARKYYLKIILLKNCQGSRESTGIQGMTMDPQAVGLRMTGLSQGSNNN
jgi:hypothetical protein